MLLRGKGGYIWFLNSNNRIVQYNGKEIIYDKLGASGSDLYFLMRNRQHHFHPLQASFFCLESLRDPSNSKQQIYNFASPYPLDDSAFQNRINGRRHC